MNLLESKVLFNNSIVDSSKSECLLDYIRAYTEYFRHEEKYLLNREKFIRARATEVLYENNILVCVTTQVYIQFPRRFPCGCLLFISNNVYHCLFAFLPTLYFLYLTSQGC